MKKFNLILLKSKLKSLFRQLVKVSLRCIKIALALALFQFTKRHYKFQNQVTEIETELTRNG
jgi:hypothetical protein